MPVRLSPKGLAVKKKTAFFASGEKLPAGEKNLGGPGDGHYRWPFRDSGALAMSAGTSTSGAWPQAVMTLMGTAPSSRGPEPFRVFLGFQAWVGPFYEFSRKTDPIGA
jgi:hypothetical protein